MNLKKLLLTLTFLLSLSGVYAQASRVQFINNCADRNVQGVDVYIDNVVVFNDILYRWNTEYQPINALAPVTIGIADLNATGINDTFYSTKITLTPGVDYIFVLNGIKSSTGYSPKKPLNITVISMARESAIKPTGTDIVFVHGSTDADVPVDVKTGMRMVGDDLGYGGASKDYAQLENKNNTIRLTNAAGTSIIKNYLMPLPVMNYSGKAAVVVSSGFVDPANNSNGPSFGLFMSVPTIAGPMIPLDTTVPEPLAKMQIINDVADTTADSVDIYFDDVKVYSKLPFLYATVYQEILARTTVTLGIAPANSYSVLDTFYSSVVACDSGQYYLGIANGIESDTGFSPRPPFNINFFSKSKYTGTSGQTDILTFNGSTDAPDLNITDGSALYGSGLAYNNYNATYTTVNTANALLTVSKSSGSAVIKKYDANWQTLGLQDKAITLLTAGFIDTAKNPANKVNFGLWYATADGGALTPLPVHTVSVENIPANKYRLSVWPNPATNILRLSADMDLNKTTAAVYDITGKLVQFSAVISNACIDVKKLPAGEYILKLSDAEKNAAIRFNKE